MNIEEIKAQIKQFIEENKLAEKEDTSNVKIRFNHGITTNSLIQEYIEIMIKYYAAIPVLIEQDDFETCQDIEFIAASLKKYIIELCDKLQLDFELFKYTDINVKGHCFYIKKPIDMQSYLHIVDDLIKKQFNIIE